jgi:hypothetical protein
MALKKCADLDRKFMHLLTVNGYQHLIFIINFKFPILFISIEKYIVC